MPAGAEAEGGVKRSVEEEGGTGGGGEGGENCALEGTEEEEGG